MKANELAIGDYVLFATRITKVEGIAIGGFAIALENEGWQSIESVEPLPITAEILEKNGFRVDGSGTNCRCLLSPMDEPGIRFNMYVGLKYKTIDVFAAHPQERTKGWRKSNKVYLEISGPYVHELQHAIRTCGIEKDIVL